MDKESWEEYTTVKKDPMYDWLALESNLEGDQNF